MVIVVGGSVFPKVSVLGSRIANVEPTDAVRLLETVADEGKSRGYVCLSNVHTTITGVFDSSYQAITNGAYMALPDGKPLVWALRLLDVGPSRRTNGPMLMEEMLDRAPVTGHRHFFFGGSEEARDKLLARYSNHNVVGCFSPPFREPTPEEDREHAAMINDVNPHFLWVGLGAPKQERWMARMAEQIDAPLLLGVGAAFDQLSGLKERAPTWMQDRGLEWAYRLAQEPRRLGKRYVMTNSMFLLGLSGQVIAHRLGGLFKRFGRGSQGSGGTAV
jgi:N-acetylglucosaminyldiphosphoundecaprenol N-acetyl-beta-D-mannosaminyltransferase